MALFLFVVFMLNVDRIKANATPFYYPLWLLLMVGLLGYIAYRILGASSNAIEPVILSEQTKQLGVLLYQKYALAFEVMGVALLTSMLGAIALVIKPKVAS
jgi:NADH-quinone oxidoreductase subunit J